MESDMIHKELIQLDMDVVDADDFFSKLCNKLVELGYVNESFYDAITKREKEFPTGLPTQPYAVAIPHADPQYIIKPFIAATRLKNAIKWCEMATSDVWHDVKFIFMLGFKRENGHVELLQILVENFQDEKLMNKLLDATTEEEYMKIILSMKGFNEKE
ncbi:PTS sugar transporter subunit IIA [Breznakia pachnodae]|jgi:PTS system galactitol-specific IIA component|uniref:PTS system galactitol-specific IIA component n=1 Tax=Breznakia pachnodae TaxID=265178 RepID=A0ABU0E1R8_9FIRM|nr:PTS sugar transporter subunit IIA [Breznakia pachnodae]MDQ0360761.1 PTS system galactitol-specific IIA component [Breznakia pachnodae]